MMRIMATCSIWKVRELVPILLALLSFTAAMQLYTVQYTVHWSKPNWFSSKLRKVWDTHALDLFGGLKFIACLKCRVPDNGYCQAQAKPQLSWGELDWQYTSHSGLCRRVALIKNVFFGMVWVWHGLLWPNKHHTIPHHTKNTIFDKGRSVTLGSLRRFRTERPLSKMVFWGMVWYGMVFCGQINTIPYHTIPKIPFLTRAARAARRRML